MASTREETSIVIIGGGVSGLTLAAFLQKSGVRSVVLERRDRDYVSVRQRAGVVDARGVGMFERWGLAEKLLAGPLAQMIDYRINGISRQFEVTSEDGVQGRFCTQQMLINNLLKELIDEMGGDVRFEASDVTIMNEESSRPVVTYTDVNGVHKISCDYIVGCDGSRGSSRNTIPEGIITTYTHEFGYAWLAALVEAPLKGNALMGISDHGGVAQLPRGPHRSRYYLQVPLADGVEDWPDSRMWAEIRKRVGDDGIESAIVHDKFFVPLRSVVHAPMQFRNLFLAGDAAHLVPPTSAKGMNLALFDVDILADALLTAIRDGERSKLDGYSERVLPHIWNYQDFAVWMTDMMHDAGDPTLHGTFRQKIARARLDNLFDSPTAALIHGEYQRGTN